MEGVDEEEGACPDVTGYDAEGEAGEDEETTEEGEEV